MEPYIAKRNGMKVIRVFSDGIIEVITNAYGNGIINNKPDCIKDNWDGIVTKAKLLDIA